MKQYQEHLKKILTDESSGYKPNRTGIDSISLFGHQNKYDLSEGFPLVTTKKMFTKSIVHELLWFLKGDTNIKYLVDNNVNIWNDNAFQNYLQNERLEGNFEMYSPLWNEKRDEYILKIKEDDEFAEKHGDLGPVYGKQWRDWRTSDGKSIDQISKSLSSLKDNPLSRRNIVSAWNVEEVNKMALPPCHTFFQFNVRDDKLDCQLYQRSADMFLGVPFNIASYAMLTEIFAQQSGLTPGNFIHTFGDSHIYCGTDKRGRFYENNFENLKKDISDMEKPEEYKELGEWIDIMAPSERIGEEGQDHVSAVLEQLSREPKQLPKLKMTSGKNLEELTYEDFEISSYDSHPAIRREMAV